MMSSGDYEPPTLNEKDILYWAHDLSELPTLEMVVDKDRPANLSNCRDVVRFEMTSDIILKLRDICVDNDCTLLTGFLSLYAICMCRHTTQTEVVIGNSLSEKDTKEDFGLLINYIGSSSLCDVLKHVSLKVKNASANRNATLSEVIKALDLRPDSRRNLLFQCMLNFTAIPNVLDQNLVHLDNLCEFVLNIQEHENGFVEGYLHYATDLFDRSTAVRFADHFRVLMESAVTNVHEPLDSLTMLTEEERTDIQEWNSTDTNFGPFTRIDRLFEHIATSHPANEAMRLDGKVMTFGELNNKADLLASKLCALNVEVAERVGVILERSFDMFVTILAVLKVGAVIVPIDIAHTPMDRIEYMFTDSSVRYVICHDVFETQLNEIAGSFIIVCWSSLERAVVVDKYETHDSTVAGDTEAIFGIFYTSGTTGRPKGVMTLHRNVFNLSKAFGKYFDIQTTDRILQFASYSFIQSLRQIWPTFCSGMCICGYI
jgi:non-ribosomal peptide synthetase component F